MSTTRAPAAGHAVLKQNSDALESLSGLFFMLLAFRLRCITLKKNSFLGKLMKTLGDVMMKLTLKLGERMLIRLGAFGVGLMMMTVSTLGLASVLSDLAKTVLPGEFVELKVGGTVSTCQAMVPPWPTLPLYKITAGSSYQRDDEGNYTLREGGSYELDINKKKIPIPRPRSMRNILEFTDEAHWDSANKEIYIAGTRRAYKPWDQGFVKYSEATNSWIILDLPPFGLGAHGYDNGAIDVSRGTFYWSRVAQANNVWSMSLATGDWTQLPNAPIAAGEQSALEYFPDIDRLVFFDARGGRASMYALYNPATNTWDAPVSLAEPFGGVSHFSEYNPTHGVMFFGGGFNYRAPGTVDLTPDINESRRFYMLDDARKVTRLPDAPIALGQRGAGPIQTIDPNTGNLVVFQGEASDGSWPCTSALPTWEYDLNTNSWGRAGEQSLTSLYCAMDSVAVPLYEYGVNFVVSVRNENNCKVYLYRHKAENAELNIIDQPSAVTVEQGQVATFNVAAVGRGVLSFQWRKNGVDITDATEASYSFTASDMANNGSEFDVVVRDASEETVTSNPAALTIIADTAAPTLLSAFAASDTLVNMVFSEAIDASGAETSANYQFDPSISVTSASLSGDGRSVNLTVSELIEGTTYTVSVSNVQDLAQTPNTIDAQSSQTFTYRVADNFEDGNADGWEPADGDRWEVITEADGNKAYYLKAAGSSPGGSRLSEYSLWSGEYGDFTLTARAKLGSTADNADYAVVFGFEDAENYYYMMFNNNQSYTQLFQVSRGERSAPLATATQDWLNDSDYHNIEVSRIGNAITVRFDGNEIFSVTDNRLGVAGRVGVGSFNDTAYFDDVSVTGAGAGTNPPSTPSTPRVTITTN